MKWAILTYIILNPLFSLWQVGTRGAQEVCYQLSSVIVFACGMFFEQRKLKLDRVHVCLGVMLIAFVIAWIRSMNGWTNALNFILGLLVYYTIVRTMKKEDFAFVIKGVVWLSILGVVWLALQKMGYDIKDITIKNSWAVGRNSFFYHASSMGMFYAESIPLILSNTWVGIILLPMLKFSECQIAILAVIASVLFFYWFYRRIVFWVLLLCLTVVVPIYFMKYDLSELKQSMGIRLPLWGKTLQHITRIPIGHGLDGYSYPTVPGYAKFYTRQNDNSVWVLIRQRNGSYKSEEDLMIDYKHLLWMSHPHNEYLWIGYDVGIHAWVILGFLFYFIWERFRVSRKEILACAFMASLVSFAIFSLAQFPLHLARIGYMLPFIMGGFYVTTEVNNEPI